MPGRRNAYHDNVYCQVILSDHKIKLQDLMKMKHRRHTLSDMGLCAVEIDKLLKYRRRLLARCYSHRRRCKRLLKPVPHLTVLIREVCAEEDTYYVVLD